MSAAPVTGGPAGAAPVTGGRGGQGDHGGRGKTRLQAERRLGLLLVAPAVLVLLALTAFPFAYNIWNSVHNVDFQAPVAGNPFVGLSNYAAVFGAGGVGNESVRTAGWTVVSVAVELVIGMVLALVIARSFPGRDLVRAAILIPWAVPTVVSAMLWRTMFDPRVGFVDPLLQALHLPGAHTTWLSQTWTAWAAVLVADAWKNTPFMAVLLYAGLQTIPGEVLEAARVDGASPWQSFWKVTVPLLRPALLVALIFRTLSSLLVFDVIYVMTGGGPGNATQTIAYGAWQQLIVNANFGVGGAISVLLVVLSLAVAGTWMRVLRPAT